MDSLRELASSFEYQIMYSRMQKGMPIEFFSNKKDFTDLQLSFMYWLEIYNNLYSSLSEKKRFLNDEVIKNKIRCDAYLKFRDKYETNDNQPSNVNINNNIRNKKKKNMKVVPGVPAVVYKAKG